MRINFKLFNFRRLYIHFCFLALLNIFFSTGNSYANTFSINDIEISTPFEINFNKNEIIDEGFVKAFNRLILSIAQTKDQNKLKKISLIKIKGMIETFSIKEEKFIDGIYYLTLNVSFNKKNIFDLFESQNIFPSLPIKRDVFFMPIIIDKNKDEILIFSENYLFNNWNTVNKKFYLINYILPTEDLDDFNLIKRNLENYDFEEIIQKYNLDDYIIMIVFKNDKEIRVLNKINFNKKTDLKNLSFKNLKLDSDNEINKFIETLKSIFENYWKSKNEINTSVKLSLKVSINNSDSSRISQFEKILSNVDLIYNFQIYKFNNKENFYNIIFNGSPDYFLEIMKNKHYEFNTQNMIWSIK
jgi:hypothetical protein